MRNQICSNGKPDLLLQTATSGFPWLVLDCNGACHAMVTMLVVIKILFIWKKKTNSLWNLLHQLQFREKKAENILHVENHRIYRMCHEEISKAPKKGVTRQYARLGCKCLGPDMSASRRDSTVHFGQVRGYFSSNRNLSTECKGNQFAASHWICFISKPICVTRLFPMPGRCGLENRTHDLDHIITQLSVWESIVCAASTGSMSPCVHKM